MHVEDTRQSCTSWLQYTRLRIHESPCARFSLALIHAYLQITMKPFPQEIWEAIFALACTDSGYTGRSLALTCKFFDEASLSVRYQRVALFGSQHIISFDNVLRNAPPHARHVRFLYISLRSRKSSELEEGDAGVTSQNTIRADNVTKDAAKLILATVAEDVQVLEVHCFNYIFSDVPLVPFPQLTDLAADSFPLASALKFPDNLTPLYPKLLRWHITDADHCWDKMEKGFGCIPKLAPTLVVLRVSGVGQTSIGVELRNAFGIKSPPEYGRSTKPVAMLPSSLKRVYVKPSSCPIGGWCGTSEDEYEGEIAYLEALNKVQDSRFVLLKAYKRAEEGTIGRTTNDWEAAIYGEDGCWSLDDKLGYDEDIEYEAVPEDYEYGSMFDW